MNETINLYNTTPMWNQVLPQGEYILRYRNGVDLGELSVFICSVLLSLGGCFAIVAAHLRRSNCRLIDCCCLKCERENLNINSSVDVGV